MRLWNYCAICGGRIEVGEPCIGVEKNSELIGDSICLDCAKIENFPGGKEPVPITDLLARLEWVSVEEKLPDAEEEVRLCCVTVSGYHYQCHGFYVPPGTYRDDSGYSWDWECCEEYDEERDDYLVNPGWYECIHNWDEYSACGIVDKVTHWMPLPGLPKEESL